MNKTTEDNLELDDQEQNDDLQEDQDEASEGSEGEGQETESDEVEIVLKGGEGSQPRDQSNFGIRKRINKLNGAVSLAKDEAAGADQRASQAEASLATERERTKLLQLALDQQEAKAPTPPDPLDYDDGAKDTKYVEALGEYTRGFLQAELEKQKPTPAAPQVDQGLERRQTQHYEAADKLGVQDYDEFEDKAIEVLGRDNTNQLIKGLDNSPAVLYYLGRNPVKAEEIASLIQRDPVKGILELGVLSAGLSVQSKTKRNKAPDPDDELEGSTSPRKQKTRGPQGATFE